MDFDNYEIVSNWINTGVDINQNIGEVNPLCRSIYLGNKDIIKLLLDNGADINKISPSGANPLLMCVQTGDFQTFKTLIDMGVNINFKSDDYHMYFLCKMIFKGLNDFWTLLINHPDFIMPDPEKEPRILDVYFNSPIIKKYDEFKIMIKNMDIKFYYSELSKHFDKKTLINDNDYTKMYGLYDVIKITVIRNTRN